MASSHSKLSCHSLFSIEQPETGTQAAAACLGCTRGPVAATTALSWPLCGPRPPFLSLKDAHAAGIPSFVPATGLGATGQQPKPPPA
jgi:hypothetical protein